MKLSRAFGRPMALIGLPILVAAMAGGWLAAPASAAEGTIRNAGSTAVVKDSFIVVLKSSATVPATVKNLTDTYGGRVGRTYRHALGGFEVSMSETAAKKLAADSKVKYVQKNGIFRINTTQSNPAWGLDRIDQRALPLSTSYTYDGTAPNVHAYIIDTGIRFSHSQFGGRAVSGIDAMNNDSDASDCNGHGTHVAGTVGGSTYGVAKQVQLVGVRVLDCSGNGTTASVVGGIDWVTNNAIRPAVANMSLGGDADSVLDDAVKRSISAGITYAVASGNDNRNACNYSPARVPAAITVNSISRTDARASDSNFGNCSDLFAPGVSIPSSWYNSDTATRTISGTSMATPHVTGVAALILSANTGFTPAQVASAVVDGTTPDVVTSPGSGSPNRLLFSGTAGTVPTTPPVTACSGTSGTDVSIPDNGAAVTSPIAISGCGRSAGTGSSIAVQVVHSFRGDLVLDLVAPDGTAYRLKGSSSSDSTANVGTTYTVNLGSEAADGTWRLQAQDVARADTGYIDTWTLTV